MLSVKSTKGGKNLFRRWNTPPTLLATTGAFFISLAPVFVKASSVGPTMAGFYRSLIGGIILISIVIFKRVTVYNGFVKLLLSTVTAVIFGTGLTFWHRSILVIGPGPSTILANFQVFFLLAIGLFVFKEKVKLRRLFSIPLAIIGITLLVGVEKFTNNVDHRTGAIYGLIAAFCYALYVIFLKKLQTNETTIGQLSNFSVVSLICAIFMGIEGYLQGETFSIPDPNSVVYIFLYGVFCQAIGWILISVGLPFISASRIGLILMIQPSGAFLWDIILFHRQTTGIEIFGAMIALSAIYIGGVKH